MEEDAQLGKKSNKIILSIVVIIIVLAVIALDYNQISSFLLGNGGTIDQSTCSQMMTDWCNQCLSANSGRKDFWNVNGAQADDNLVTCSNSYFGNDMTFGQDCTGKALVYCSKFISLQIE